MKIKILKPYTDSRTHNIVYAGSIIDESNDRAALLIRRGFAEEYKEVRKRGKKAKAEE